MVLLNPFHTPRMAVRLVVALVAAILVTLSVIRLVLWLHGSAAMVEWAGAIATIGAFAFLLRKVVKE